MDTIKEEASDAVVIVLAVVVLVPVEQVDMGVDVIIACRPRVVGGGVLWLCSCTWIFSLFFGVLVMFTFAAAAFVAAVVPS